MSHNFFMRIAYADTDAGGVVYHARYLEIAERARLEMLRDCDLLEMVTGIGGARNQGAAPDLDAVQLVVRRAEIDYRLPVRLDDLVLVQSRVIDWSGARFTLEQLIFVETQLMVGLKVQLATIDRSFRPQRIPELLRQRLGGSL
ncbi:MAG: YbgC/FadM family acyl-CoA thioesterase [Candidatus Pacebacteria bacterium]|nr:YbgC/FadM family acyl-CoA thioesterase [Candidatus Paceibacterota bacterium]